jgi:hypothetical protein
MIAGFNPFGNCLPVNPEQPSGSKEITQLPATDPGPGKRFFYRDYSLLFTAEKGFSAKKKPDFTPCSRTFSFYSFLSDNPFRLICRKNGRICDKALKLTVTQGLLPWFSGVQLSPAQEGRNSEQEKEPANSPPVSSFFLNSGFIRCFMK